MNRNVLMCDVKYYIFQWLKDEKGKHENGVDLSTLFLLNNKELRKRETSTTPSCSGNRRLQTNRTFHTLDK